METTYNMPVNNNFIKKRHFVVHYSTKLYKIVQYCTVRQHERNLEFRYEFLDPKNLGKDI